MIDGQPCYIIVDALINFILLQCIQHILIYFSIFNIFNSTIGVLCVCGNALYPLLDIWGHLGIHVRHSVLEGVLGVSKTAHTDCCKPSNIKAVVRTVYKSRYNDNLPYSWTWRALPESPFRIPAILSS